MLQRIKRITSHAGKARYNVTLEWDKGYIPRQADIPSPYAYSPTHSVSYDPAKKTHVIVVETAHKRYDVFAVPADMIEPNEDRILAALTAGKA
jgi:hypothetical protein